MKHFLPLILSCFVLSFFNEGISLKCRSGNQQVDAQFQKVLATCKKRHGGLNTDNSEDSISTESSSSESESNSNENVYDKKFFNEKGDRTSYNQSTSTQRYRNFDSNGDANASDRSMNGNRNFQNTKHIRKSNDQNSWNSRDSQIGNSNFNKGGKDNEDARLNNSTDREQACVIQCFFNELNVVDQKGFPERDLVIPLMSQNIQDPELKDFVEESIVECFRYLETSKREKCEFSQNLLTCLADKGQQKCDDWEN